jgi:hypothetical protein
MSIFTANKTSEVMTTVEIDWLGVRFGVVRDDNESLSDYRERVISALVFPSSVSDVGFSMSIARALNCSPKVIGFIQTAESFYIRNSGHRITLMTDLQTEVKTYEAGEEYSLHDLDTYLQENSYGSITYIDKYKYRCKNLSFILPFANFENRRVGTVQEGVSVITDKYIVDGSIASDSDYIKTRVIDPSLITKLGQYYFDGAHTLITYDSGKYESIDISYAMKWNTIAILYSPVRVVSLPTISRTSDINNYENKINKAIDGTENNTFIDFDPLYKDLFWNAIAKNNALWKANENNPVSVNGTYYGK